LKNRIQSIQQASEEKIKFDEAINNRLKIILDGDFKVNNQRLDQKSKEHIASVQRETEARLRREKARAENRMAGFQAGGAVIGGVIGAIYGGPGGAAVGSQTGGATGTLIGASTQK
jgi:outer membrane lipoprotein SlyB